MTRPALKAILSAARHVCERKMDEARDGRFSKTQVLVAALVLEAAYVALRISPDEPDEEPAGEPIHIRCPAPGPPVAVQHYGSEFGPN
jgi:hypothetical protein